MADQRLIGFIQEALKKGNSRVQIEQVLVHKGWNAEQVKAAFVEISTPTRPAPTVNVPTKKPLMKSPLFFVLLGLIFLLILTGVTYWYVTSSGCSTDSDCDSGFSCTGGECVENECATDSDCGRGEECSSGNCVTVEEEEVEVTTTVEEEPECSSDIECGSFACSDTGSCYDSCVDDTTCASGYSCDGSTFSCEEEDTTTTTTNTSSAEVDYDVLDIDLSSFSSPTSLAFYVNYTNLGDASNTTNPSLACLLSFANGTFLNSTTSYVSYLDVNDTALSSCTVYSVTLLSEIETYTSVNVSLNGTINYYRNISETDYSNSYVEEFNVSLFNTTVLSTTTCTDSSSCSGYDCSVVSYCYDTCTVYGSECADGYSCDTGTGVCSASASVLGNTCSGEGTSSDCPGYVCHSAVCIECMTDYTDACATGYACDIDSASSTFHTCFSDCSSGDTACADGYSCGDSNTCESDATTSGVTDCNDGEDDDSDGYYDYSGACLLSDAVTISSCDDSTFSADFSSSDCESYCETTLGGRFYTQDTGCIGADDLSEQADCNDGLDNDGDGFTDDGSDPQCSTSADKSELYACSDGIDNGDQDGLIDYGSASTNDDECSCDADNYENNANSEEVDCEVCTDSSDNDYDGLTDCDDSDCATDSACTGESACSDTIPSCADGEDNDLDGDTDLSDSECTTWEDEEAGEGYTCVDTDSSKSDPYLVAGTLTLTASNGVETVVDDYCSGDTLYEYSCGEEGSSIYNSNSASCATLYDSTYSCIDGSCVPLAEEVTCEESGKDPDPTSYEYYSITRDFTVYDECVPGDSDASTSGSAYQYYSYLMELYCPGQGENLLRKSYYGYNGCQQEGEDYLGHGPWKLTTSESYITVPTCASDDDNADDPFTSGTAHYGSYLDVPDECLGPESNYLLESYCDNSDDPIYQKLYLCAYGCEDGACLSEERPACSNAEDDDSDGVYYDYLGACDISGDGLPDVSCSVMGETTALNCDSSCEKSSAYDGTYFSADPNCTNADDEFENSDGVSNAPAQEQNFLQRFFHFLFTSPS
ncbi:hypothetical protein EXS74_03540, partial [Candidatus Woesearchaeota archaeon]|nr:hypothetical protein [Candidatus Woesearchaeota archaeon]